MRATRTVATGQRDVAMSAPPSSSSPSLMLWPSRHGPHDVLGLDLHMARIDLDDLAFELAHVEGLAFKQAEPFAIGAARSTTPDDAR